MYTNNSIVIHIQEVNVFCNINFETWFGKSDIPVTLFWIFNRGDVARFMIYNFNNLKQSLLYHYIKECLSVANDLANRRIDMIFLYSEAFYRSEKVHNYLRSVNPPSKGMSPFEKKISHLKVCFMIEKVESSYLPLTFPFPLESSRVQPIVQW